MINFQFASTPPRESNQVDIHFTLASIVFHFNQLTASPAIILSIATNSPGKDLIIDYRLTERKNHHFSTSC